ncbi:hypothetical protein EIN_064430 [Entamoeba invadens IP1]|uniref:Uncharacterized protein n=1 Tax=Entamoeba invadens IP1 TaxID=370355 RepID=A0A0A1U000_ENTIV|nr:hypothetical protein EIN_064430 [Entamoeba invadens IP1]ELP84218.1 hypothetical protein EIN_064430 [Entamoeba invadens IP1]|eukprot:XP_004183564.1 hypothetical protein EIN_064430 [Entamoeba invadens IP1]
MNTTECNLNCNSQDITATCSRSQETCLCELKCKCGASGRVEGKKVDGKYETTVTSDRMDITTDCSNGCRLVAKCTCGVSKVVNCTHNPQSGCSCSCTHCSCCCGKH